MRYRRPSRRRLKKWTTRAERLVLRANARGFLWFMSELVRLLPLTRAAEHCGVNLIARFDALPPLPPEQLHEALEAFVMGHRYVPTKRNLEI